MSDFSQTKRYQPDRGPADDIVTRLHDWHGPVEPSLLELVAEALDEIERLRAAVDPLIDALVIEGRCPPHHRNVMAKHRREWPVLWRAIDALQEARRG